MSRTILYYPNIQIPTSGTWIRRSLLYWDKLAAIVPQSYDDQMDAMTLKRYSPEIECLYKEGLFQPFNPETLMWKEESRKALSAELKTTLGSIRPKKNLLIFARRCDVPIYRDKVAGEVFDALEKRGVAARSQDDPSVYLFESYTANVYMALLAKHLALNAPDPTVPSSDSAAELELIYGNDEERTPKNLIISPHLNGLIPTPGPDVPLRSIMKFKAKHEAELIAFRTAIDEFERDIKSCENTQELKSVLQSQKEKIRKQTIELSNALKANTIAAWLGSLQSFIKPTSPTLWGAALVAAGKAASLTAMPMTWMAGGAAVAGSIEVGMHWFNKVQERKVAIRNTPFAYLFLATKKLQ